MQSAKYVHCPVCTNMFSPTSINEHVNECLNSEKITCTEDGTDPPSILSSKRKLHSPKSGWGFLMSNDTTGLAKKMKVSQVTNAPDKETPIRTIDKNNDNDTSGLVLRNSTNVEHKNIQHRHADIKPVFTNSTTDSSGSKTCEQYSPVKDNVDSMSLSLDLSVPLAEQMRPICFENYLGQDRALGKDRMMWSLLQSDSVPSMILWGPPGCGKTTLAKIIAKKCKGRSKFIQLSATSSGVNDVKQVIKNAKNDYSMFRKRTILFLDEIHRFNKLQQDSLLPHVEDGTITLIGATTENPSFQVNTALLSRCRVLVLDKLDNEAILQILMKTVDKLHLKVFEDNVESSCGNPEGVFIEKKSLEFLSAICDGDARAALNGLQMTVQSQLARTDQSISLLQANCSNSKTMAEDGKRKTAYIKITSEHVKDGLQRSHIAYDKTGEEHYNTISALHKSMRGSDDSAALYWLARMMEGGEEPLYIARRLIEFASEDVGIADPQALMLAVSTYQACHFIGRPECEKPLAECVVYLSRAPKSVEAYVAYSKAKACIHDHQGPLPGVPLHLRNASSKLMKNLGYGKGYKYNPSHEGPVQQEYFPECLTGSNFFK